MGFPLPNSTNDWHNWRYQLLVAQSMPTCIHSLNQIFLDTVDNPQVLHVFSWCGIESHRPRAVTIVRGHGASCWIPTPEWPSQTNRVCSRSTQVHRSHQNRWRNRRTRPISCAFTKTGTDDSITRHRFQNPVIKIVWIGTRLARQIFFGYPISAIVRAIQENVVPGESTVNGKCDTPNAISVVICHGLGLGIAKHTSTEIKNIGTRH